MKEPNPQSAATEGFVLITSIWTAREIAPTVDPHYIISLVEPGSHFSIPTGPALRRHLRLGMHDIDNQGAPVPAPYVGTTVKHVQEIIDAARTWDRASIVLIHCVAGVSRSGAAGLVFLAARNPGREMEVARRLRQEGPWLDPNPSIVGLGDDLLGLQGTLRRALEAMGEPSMCGGGPVTVPMTI
jgi:predicted protein tyrosine phosphatase